MNGINSIALSLNTTVFFWNASDFAFRKRERGISDDFPFFADVRKRRRRKKRSRGEEGLSEGRERRSASAVRLEQETHHLRGSGVKQRRKVLGEKVVQESAKAQQVYTLRRKVASDEQRNARVVSQTTLRVGISALCWITAELWLNSGFSRYHFWSSSQFILTGFPVSQSIYFLMF